jgi:hypothetical protein
MSNDPSKIAARDLTSVSDVDGADPDIRDKVSRSGADAEAATAALRDALAELHRSDDEAWRRYAVDLEEATRRFDTTVGLASARLRAERAASKEDLGVVLDDVMHTWRSRADEMRVRASVGQMDARDFLAEAVAELDLATQRLVAVGARLRSEVGDSLAAMRTDVTAALDDAARILRGFAR